MTAKQHPAPPPESGVRDPRQLPFSSGRSRGRLPHLEKEGCTYFVTFCLASATAKHASRRRHIEEERTPIEIARFSEPPTGGDSLLSDRDLATVVEAALLFFQEDRYALHAWVVMPDHVHVVVTPSTHTLKEILQSWKSFAAHRINQVAGRSGRVWQAESFDHIIRSNDGYERFVEYVENNPVDAGLCDQPADWRFSSARHRTG